MRPILELLQHISRPNVTAIYDTPTFNELLRDIMSFYETPRPNVTAIYDTPTFNELLRDISRPNVTAIYDTPTFNDFNLQ